MAQANSMQASGSKLDNRRVLAALIDLAVVGAGGAVILAAAGVLGESPSEIGVPLLASIVGWALYYYFACESGAGQTLGKRAMKLRVVSESGSPADMRAIALRTVLRVIDMQLAGIVGLVVMNSTKERRARLGDLVGGTKVVSAEGRAAGRPKPKATVAATPVSRGADRRVRARLRRGARVPRPSRRPRWWRCRPPRRSRRSSSRRRWPRRSPSPTWRRPRCASSRPTCPR